MANDYMAKLAADLEGMSMMRSPKPMTVVYRDAGGDLDFDYNLSEAADIAADEGFSDTGGANTQGNMDAVDAMAYMQAAIADPDLPTGDQFDPSTPASEGGIPQRVAEAKEKERQDLLDFLFAREQLKDMKPGDKITLPNPNSIFMNTITKQGKQQAPDVPYPTNRDGSIDYNTLFDRYATPEEKNRETQPPTDGELMNRHNEFFDQELMGLKNNMTRGFSDDPDMRLLADGSLFDGKAEGGAIPTIYRDMGGDLDFDYDLEEAADIAAGEQAAAEAQAAELDQEDKDLGTQTPTDDEIDDIAAYYGFGSPSRGVAGAQEGFKGFGDPDLGGFYSSGTATQLLKERLNKPGGMTKAEQLLYTKLLETGLVGSEAMAKMAELLGTPGVAAAVESGYSDGYQYGGILGDALAARENTLGAMSAEIKKAEKKVREGYKEQEDRDALGAIEEVEPEATNYFGDILGDVFGGIKDYFMGPSKEDELAFAQAVQDAGYTFSPISDEAKYVDFALGNLPGLGGIPFAKGLYDVAAFATDSRIIGDVDTPYGTFQLTESGDLTAPDMSEDMSDFGNESAITKKRKAATQPVKKEEEKKEEEKNYFPKQKLPSLTQSGLEALQYAYRNDPPEVLDNILNKYTLPDQTSGLRALV